MATTTRSRPPAGPDIRRQLILRQPPPVTTGKPVVRKRVEPVAPQVRIIVKEVPPIPPQRSVTPSGASPHAVPWQGLKDLTYSGNRIVDMRDIVAYPDTPADLMHTEDGSTVTAVRFLDPLGNPVAMGVEGLPGPPGMPGSPGPPGPQGEDGDVPEAPEDGQQYAREDGTWTVVEPAASDWADITGKPATFPPTVPIPYSNISGTPTIPTTLPPSGTAGGDLSGSYPNPLIKPSVTNGQVLTTVAGVAAWAAAAGGGASISIDVTPPVSPTAGALWWNSDAATGGGQLMIFYVDPGGAPGQWVPASPGMSTPTTPGGDFCAIGASPASVGGTLVTLTPATIVSGNTGSWYVPGTGRYSPPAGRYFIAANVNGHTSAISHLQLQLRKNGVAIQTVTDTTGGNLEQSEPSISLTVDANGTDWFDVQALGTTGTITITNATFTAFPLSGIKGPPGDPGVGLLQTVSYQTGAVATGTTLIPSDDTIPQITEGTEFLTVAITPRSATSKLIINVNISLVNSAAGVTDLIAALFQDSGANALAAKVIAAGQAYVSPLDFTHTMVSGTTSATTFRVRAGSGTAGTITVNGYNGTRRMGGVMASSIVIQEVL